MRADRLTRRQFSVVVVVTCLVGLVVFVAMAVAFKLAGVPLVSQ